MVKFLDELFESEFPFVGGKYGQSLKSNKISDQFFNRLDKIKIMKLPNPEKAIIDNQKLAHQPLTDRLPTPA